MYSCSLCSQKGFICEICNNGEILYPFEDISTSRYRISCLITVYLDMSHAVLLGPIGPAFSQVLCLYLCLCIRFPVFLENIIYPLVSYICFQLTLPPLSRMIKQSCKKKKKPWCRSALFGNKEYAASFFRIKMAVEEFSQPPQGQVIGCGNHSLRGRPTLDG